MAAYWLRHCNLIALLTFPYQFWGKISITLKVLLDTNFLLIPAQFGIDIFQELERIVSRKFELIILTEIIEELKNFSKKSIKRQKEAQIALDLAKRCKLIDSNYNNMSLKNVDDIIFHSALTYGWIVATNDRKLRKKLRDHQIPVITLRKKAFLVIEGDIPSY